MAVRHHAATCGLVPEDVLFIDDVAANVEASRAAGWQALQFTSPDELRRDLQLLEVIV